MPYKLAVRLKRERNSGALLDEAVEIISTEERVVIGVDFNGYVGGKQR